MKVLKYILVVIIVFVGGFFSMGLLHPTGGYENRLEINKPVAEVYDDFMQEGNLEKWLFNIKSIEHQSGTKGEVGAVYKFTFDENGEEVILIETVLEIEPNKAYKFRYVNEFILGSERIVFNEKGNNTELVITSEFEGAHILAKSALAFFNTMMKEQSLKNYERFKAFSEKS